MAKTAEIGIIGDFNRAFHSHWAIEAALHHSAERLGVRCPNPLGANARDRGAGRGSVARELRRCVGIARKPLRELRWDARRDSSLRAAARSRFSARAAASSIR